MERITELAEVDWRSAAPIRIMLREYTFASLVMVLNERTANCLLLSNVGNKIAPFVPPLFLARSLYAS